MITYKTLSHGLYLCIFFLLHVVILSEGHAKTCEAPVHETDKRPNFDAGPTNIIIGLYAIDLTNINDVNQIN